VSHTEHVFFTPYKPESAKTDLDYIVLAASVAGGPADKPAENLDVKRDIVSSSDNNMAASSLCAGALSNTSTGKFL
jgi:hypothetical protein